MKAGPKILMVGSDKIFALENYYVRYLRDAGVDLDFFNASSIFFDYYSKSIFNKVLFKVGLSPIYRKINGLFKEYVMQSRPDIIWIFKGMEIYPGTLQWLHQRNIKLVNYNPDNPFIFSGKGSGNSNVTRSVGLYDLHLTYHLGVAKMIKEKYKLPVEILPFGFDGSEELFESCRSQDEVLKACFLGNPDEHRVKFLTSLAEAGVCIDLFGNNWEKFISHPNVSSFPPVYGDGQWKILWRYRVQLNLMRIHNLDSHNMRTFEVPGIGGIMVAPDTPEHRMYFEDGKEAFFYQDVKDCARVISELLSLPAEEAAVIRNAARRRSISSGYTYKDRAMQALSYLKTLAVA